MSVHHHNTSNADAESDVYRAVTALVGATQHMQADPASVEVVELLIERLKHLHHDERHSYTLTHQNSEKRKKIESLHNLIQYLESQVQKARKATQRRGLKYYLASISNTVLGHEVSRIGQSMESKLQSFLDQQGVRDLVTIISNGSEDAQVRAISSFESVVRKGFDASLQGTILSTGIVEKLAALLEPGAASWNVQKEAAFALSALLDFNKDIFVSLVLMAKVVENVLNLMDTQTDEHVLVLICVLKFLLSAGEAIIVDEIYAQNGVPKIVKLLDHKSQALQHAGMDFVFELAYYGRIEVVEKMFKLEVIQKLASLQQCSKTATELDGVECEENSKQDTAIDWHLVNVDTWLANTTQMQNGGGTPVHPFSNAVTRFALHIVIGTGLRKRERRALKREFLKQIKEVMEDDVEAANITAEVLWAP